MKQLCLLIFLANIFLFLWEYREGNFNPPEVTSIPANAPSVENILLADEVKKDTALPSPKLNQEEQPSFPVPENTATAVPSVRDEKAISTDKTKETSIKELP